MNRGFSLLELVLAISIFAVGSLAAGLLIIDANVSSRTGLDEAQSVLVAREGLEAVTAMRDQAFSNLVITSGPHGLANPSQYTWVFSGTSDLNYNQFSRTIDISLNPPSAPFSSTSTATVSSTVAWVTAKGGYSTTTLTTILTNWRNN